MCQCNEHMYFIYMHNYCDHGNLGMQMLVIFSTDDNIKGNFMVNSFAGVSFCKKLYTVCLCDDNVSHFIMHTFLHTIYILLSIQHLSIINIDHIMEYIYKLTSLACDFCKQCIF